MWKFTGKSRPDFAVTPAPDQESVWDYPRPPICIADPRKVIVKTNEFVIAETENAIRVLETASPPTFYIPPTDVDFEVLTQSAGHSFCEWKGSATYWSVKTDGITIRNAGWSYEHPKERFADIRDYVSFYPAMLVCTVDDQIVRPQPGGFYGGWVTDEIVGPSKGEPGTANW